jgi:hypothetical protein
MMRSDALDSFGLDRDERRMLRLRIAHGEATVQPSIGPGDEVWRDNEGAICAYGQIVDQKHWMHLPAFASFCFSSHATEVTAFVGSGINHDLVIDAYHRSVLPMILQVHNREVLHASAIRTPSGVLALCGRSETGKSTLAFALSRRGYALWADDAVAYEILGLGATVISLPFQVRLRPSAAELFDVAAHIISPSRIETEAALLSGVCVLRRAVDSDDEELPPVAIRPLLSTEALVAVLPHAYCFTLRDQERKRGMMHHYMELVARIPVFDVCFRTGLENLPFVLDAIEEQVLRPGPV